MTDSASSFRQILRSSSVIGGASAANVLLGIIRTKALALLIGPSGIGLLSLYSSVVSTASAVCSLGLGAGGARQIAQAAGDKDEAALRMVRSVLFWTTLVVSGA